jgi:dipeptidyl aminopeptidase/acylaminoacyl peptidase
VAISRLAEATGADPGTARWLFRPTIESGFLYARIRHKLNFSQASPARALSEVVTPVLLIHGSDDRNIPPQQSDRLAGQRLQATVLWRVAGAGHVEAFSKEPAEFSRRVLAWFESNR